MRSLWAAGLLLRRLRTELAMVVLLAVLVAGTSFVFAAAPRLLNRTFDAALQYAAKVARPADRNVSLVLDSQVVPGPSGGITGLRLRRRPHRPRARLGHGARRESRRSIHDRPVLRSRAADLRDAHLASLPGRPDGRHEAGCREVAGRPWRAAPHVRTGNGAGHCGISCRGRPEVLDPVVVEAALSTAEATEIGVGVGDRLAVTLDGSDPLPALRSTAHAHGDRDRGAVRAAGSECRVLDRGHRPAPGDPARRTRRPIAYATAYVAPEAYPSLWASELPFHYEWRLQVDPKRLDADQVAQLEVDLRRLGFIAGNAGGSGGAAGDAGTVVILTGLPVILERYAAQRALSESVLSIAAIGPFGLAGGALAMVAILLVRRRRGALTLARGRGASGALLLGTQLWEASCSPEARRWSGCWLAVDVRRRTPQRALADSRDRGRRPRDAAAPRPRAGRLAVRPLGTLGRDDAPVLRVPPRRLVIEMTIVAIAAGATLLLRQRGLDAGDRRRPRPRGSAARLRAGARRAGGRDRRAAPVPIARSAPSAGWLRGGAISSRCSACARSAACRPPRTCRSWCSADRRVRRLLVRDRVEPRSRARSPPRTSRSARTTRSRASASARWRRRGSRRRRGRRGRRARASSTRRRLRRRPNQRASIYLEAIDPAAYQRVTAGTAGRSALARGIPRGRRDGVGTETHPIPAILSSRCRPGTPDLAPGRHVPA